MREILFRGQTYNGDWVEGAYYKQTEYYGDDFEAHYIISSKDELEDNMMIVERVIPETVGQYTGLTDKNGTKIFEGDIIIRAWNGYPTIYRIIFDELLSAFIGEVKPFGQFTTFDGDGEYFEVIGNIHDNPGLLEGGE